MSVDSWEWFIVETVVLGFQSCLNTEGINYYTYLTYNFQGYVLGHFIVLEQFG